MVLLSLEHVIYSIAYGSILALLSIGLTLTYMVTKVPNFAHATLAVTGAVITLLMIDIFYHKFYGTTLYYTLYIVAPLLAFPVVGLTALLQYVLILWPLARRGVGIIGLMIATLAFDLILGKILTLILYIFPSSYFGKLIGQSLKGFDMGVALFGAQTFFSRLILPFVAILLAITLHLFLTRTKFGVALRASIENPNLARVLGVNVDLAYMASWFLAGGLAGISGSYLAFMVESLKPEVASLVIVNVFAGSIVGGLSNIYGALVGGFLVGFTEPMAVIILQNILSPALGAPITITQYQRLFSFLIVIITLLIAPQGLLGLNFKGVLAKVRLGGVR